MADPRPMKWVKIDANGHAVECLRSFRGRAGLVVEVDHARRMVAACVLSAPEQMVCYVLPGFSGDSVPEEWGERYGL